VFGFCDIRNFMATTEVLREEVLLYVNEIASIVHSTVSAYAGNANRNMGDSMLLVWKRNGSNAHEGWTELVEKALISFLKVSIEVNRSQDIAVYNDPKSKVGARLKKVMPGFKVRLGFGLHVGWAIEGAMGSNRKIDAGYLSRHVNLTSRLEGYTRRFNSTILFSGAFYDLLGADAKKCSRKVDEVLFKGASEPVAMYTYDVDLRGLDKKLAAIRLKGDDTPEGGGGGGGVVEPVVDRRISLIGPAPIIDHTRSLAEVEKSAFRTDLELRALQWELPPHFLPLCRKGVSLYLAGKWGEARKLLEAACSIYPTEEHGPSAATLKYMAKFGYVSPAGWKGFRDGDGDISAVM
jgi:class 3 adenylate cyclase